ncbi:MAG: hypothetical protein NXI10_07410 [bacterium]|nr:hypothetical protein [bacterium]
MEAIPSERNNKCRVTIKKNNRSAIAEKELILDVPIDRSSINYCTQEYAVIGFACGGPCSSRIFIFSDKREPTQLSYCRRVKNNDNLVTHIQNEEFDDLIIHNLKNGKELIVNNPDIDWMQYGQMDTLVFSNDSLYMEYLNENGGTTKKTISISEILN